MNASNLMRRGNALDCRDRLENPSLIEGRKAFRSARKSRVHPYSIEQARIMTPKPDPSPAQTPPPLGEHDTPI